MRGCQRYAHHILAIYSDSVLSTRSPRRSPRSPRRDDRYKDSWCLRCFFEGELYKLMKLGVFKKHPQRMLIHLIGHGYQSQVSSIPQTLDCDLLPLGEK